MCEFDFVILQFQSKSTSNCSGCCEFHSHIYLSVVIYRADSNLKTLPGVYVTPVEVSLSL